jgi:hypothetical protein
VKTDRQRRGCFVRNSSYHSFGKAFRKRTRQCLLTASVVVNLGQSARATDGVLTQLKSETLEFLLEVNANKTRKMRVMTNLLNVRQDINVDGHVFEEVRLFKYLCALLTRTNEISVEVKMRTAAGCRCYCTLQDIFKFRALCRISAIKICRTMLSKGSQARNQLWFPCASCWFLAWLTLRP